MRYFCEFDTISVPTSGPKVLRELTVSKNAPLTFLSFFPAVKKDVRISPAFMTSETSPKQRSASSAVNVADRITLRKRAEETSFL